MVALKKAGLSDQEIIQRLRNSQQVFGATSEQENYLRAHGVSRDVVSAMKQMNGEANGNESASRTSKE